MWHKNTMWAFVFGSRNGRIWALTQLSLCTHNSDCSLETYFLIFVQFFPRMAPHFLCHHDSQSNSPSTLTIYGLGRICSWVDRPHLCHAWKNLDSNEHARSSEKKSCFMNRPTKSIMYVLFQVNRFQKSILLIVQYKYLKSFSEDMYSPESYHTQKIM